MDVLMNRIDEIVVPEANYVRMKMEELRDLFRKHLSISVLLENGDMLSIFYAKKAGFLGYPTIEVVGIYHKKLVRNLRLVVDAEDGYSEIAKGGMSPFNFEEALKYFNHYYKRVVVEKKKEVIPRIPEEEIRMIEYELERPLFDDKDPGYTKDPEEDN